MLDRGPSDTGAREQERRVQGRASVRSLASRRTVVQRHHDRGGVGVHGSSGVVWRASAPSAARAARGGTMSRDRFMLCVAYAVIALLALIGTWSQNVSYFRSGDGLAGFALATARFWPDTLTTPASV